MNENEPKVGDECKADFMGEDEFNFGKITKIEDGIAYTDMNAAMGDGCFVAFVGDTPTRKDDNNVWVFDSF